MLETSFDSKERVRALQRKLYQKAKQQPGFRFYSLLHIIMIMNTHSYDREHLLYSRIGSDVFLL